MKQVRKRLHRACLVLEAMAWLTAVWLTSHILPGKLYRRLLPKPSASDSEGTGGARPTASRDDLPARIGSAVTRGSDAVPFRSVCFHRGIAAYRMLRRRGIPSTLHYGVARAPDSHKLQAHVWVSSNGQDVVGGSANERFAEIAHFYADGGGTVLPGEEQ